MGQETNSDTHGIYIDPHDRLSHGGRVAALPPGEPSETSLAQPRSAGYWKFLQSRINISRRIRPTSPTPPLAHKVG